MAQKDMTEKRLENFADVFADIVNVLLFNGKRLINLPCLKLLTKPTKVSYMRKNAILLSFGSMVLAWRISLFYFMKSTGRKGVNSQN